jgi:DNA-binding transcriptional LysR family regulator
VSEPALADAIRKLERTLGLTLFERFHARGVALTRQGADFLESARRLLEAAEQAERAAAGIARGLGGSLRVGCFRTMAPFVLPALVRRLGDGTPAIDLHPLEADHARLVDALGAGELDVALLYAMTADLAPFDRRRVATLRPYAVLPQGHRLAARPAVTLAELAGEPLVLFDLPGSRHYFESLFARAGLAPRVAFRSQSLESVRSAVANGLGASVLVVRPPGELSYDGRGLAAVPLDRAVPSLDVVLAWPRGAVQGPLWLRFVEGVESCFAERAPFFAFPEGDSPADDASGRGRSA